MVDILEDPKHNVSKAVRSRSIGYKDSDPRKFPLGTVDDWWKNVKPHLFYKKGWLGQLQQSQAEPSYTPTSSVTAMQEF